ncbi:DNA-binding protein [Mucilaginibacter sp. PAMB04274]|uniref:DNA-binding protein n=1 Tax=Mucilaginibacter sp. PAMB04274 TaxID=3138568 RepID=UPI0031F62C6F
MQVICFEDEAFYEMLDRLYKRYKADNNINEEKWITGDMAMKRLGISSKTSLQKFRDEGRIRFVPVTPKNFLYDSDSINAYLDSKAQNTF